MDKGNYKWLATFLVMIGIFMALLDTTIVNISLPKMMAELNADTIGIQWVIISYLISSAIGMSVVGWLTQRVSSKAIYLVGLAIFTASSFLCGHATSLAQMTIFRLIQGIGEGLIVPIGMVILYEVFPEEELGIAMGVYGFGAALAPALGPTIGGYINDVFHWRWIFYINIPIGIVGLALTYLLLKESGGQKEKKAPFDGVGFLLLTVMLSSLILFLAKGQEKEWLQSDFILYMLILFLVSTPLYILWELKTETPITDLRLFRINPFCLSVSSFFFCSMAVYGAFIILPLYLIRLRLFPTLTAGVILLPGGIVCALTLVVAGLLADKTNPKHGFVWGGLVLMSLALLFLSHVDLNTSKWYLAYCYWVPINIAWGFGFASSAALALGSVPEEKASMASSVVNIIRLVAGSVGTAIGTANLERGIAYHFEALASRLTYENATAIQMMQKITGYLTLKGMPPEIALQKGMALMESFVAANATAYAFQWTFLCYAFFVALSIPFGFFIRYEKGESRMIALH